MLKKAIDRWLKNATRQLAEPIAAALESDPVKRLYLMYRLMDGKCTEAEIQRATCYYIEQTESKKSQRTPIDRDILAMQMADPVLTDRNKHQIWMDYFKN